MAKSKLFQYAIIWHPTHEQEKGGTRSKVLKPIQTILALDEKSVAIIASRDIDNEYLEQLDQIEIAIRPF